MKRSDFKETKEYDLIIIGGGITGAAVAYDASARGLSVALLEKDDFGSKTSSATSKLIHGGLRYLANFELGLVRESLRERRILENIAPNFVYPIPNMIITDKKSFQTKKFALKLGMILYDILSFDKKFTWDKSKRIPCHRSMSRAETIREEPLVEKKDLTGSLVYYDCASIFPERLTLAFVKSAVFNGTDAANYMEVTGFNLNGNKISGITAKDKIKNKKIKISGKLVINCAGAWADKILNLTGKNFHEEILRRSEGIHIITEKITEENLVTAMTPSGRHIFIIPWRGHSLIGTTDKEFLGSPDDWKVSRESIDGLIEEVNASFSDKIKISYEDILYCYGGLRPLVETETEDVYQSSRKYEIYDNSQDGIDGLLTVEGGKYTTSRNLALHVVEQSCKKLGIKAVRSETDKNYLAGSEIEDIEAYISYCKELYESFNNDHIDYLARIYGTELSAVIDIASENKKFSEPLNSDGELLAQVIYAIKDEMALTLNDILFRRTGIGTLGHPGKDALKKVADTAAGILGWDAAKKKAEIAAAEKIFLIP
ncbi:MAG TPA: glycerol-3-phosphate dehydrogenase/oxidase [Spirochaetota bacterium]|nr:glycerol-3-phosphate dehydrogenase/oxidase [Spirochaetota bacterium]HPJ34526.1 glycerol-3-phosphate dehydrogenase/oxidase [Spirochaetota bacterium]